SAPLWGGQLHAVVLAKARTAGEPGPGSQPTPNINRQRVRALAGLAYERHWGSRQRLQLVASTSAAHDRYTDLYGELGVSRRWNTRDASYRAFVRAADTLKLTPWLDAGVIGSYALDHYAWSDQFTFPAPAPSTRHGLAAALELAARGRLGAVGFELRPSARVEWSHTELHSGRGATGSFDATQAVTAPTARLGVGISPLRFVALSGSIATGVRLPTMFELFGDRGLVLPAPSLEPVRSTTYDAGLTLQHAQALLRGALELRGFIQKRRDEIGSYRTAQFQIAHVNLSEVQQRGFELGLRAVLFELLYLNGAATYMKTEDALGNRLPLRPLWSAFARPELRVRFEGGVASSAGASVELSHRSFVFADRANLGVIAACTTTSLSASLGLFRDHLRVTGRIEDVADARCTDLIGFPLPGRTLLLSLTYQEMTDDHA
ncbi:MAG: TonB-dependent receptor, partial [Polyangiales bacterium]